MIDVLITEVRCEEDIVHARQRARQIAGWVGCDAQDQTRIATAVSEIARNAYRYAEGGWVRFEFEDEAAPQALVVYVSDTGPGIAQLDRILAGQYHSETGMGLGIVGARRLMDDFRIESAPGMGTRVWLKKLLPRTAAPVTRARLAAIVKELARQAPQDPREELRVQNQELVRALTELHQRQQELVRLNRELEDTNRGVVALYAELDEKAEYLRRADQMKSRFLSNMSHEFRTPLYSTLALTRLLLERSDGELTSEQEKQVHFIRKGAEGLLELVNDLLDIAKIEAGKTVVQTARFEVSELFSALRGMLRPLLTNDAVSLDFEEPDGIPAMHSDEGKVAQILRNFISNALKFTERGEVRVKAALDASGHGVEFSVADTGIGIAPADQARLFEEFTQIDNPLQKRNGGTGLGLSLTRRLAALLGGSVDVVSAPGRGSTFRARIPLRYQSSGAPAETRAAAIRHDETRAHLPLGEEAAPALRECALIVDDDPAARYVLRRCLDESHWTVHEAPDGETGLARARELQPGIIFLDIAMPRVAGDEALLRLREDRATREIPVVMVTSKPLSAREREALTGLADAIVNKEELSAPLLERILRDTLGPKPTRP